MFGFPLQVEHFIYNNRHNSIFLHALNKELTMFLSNAVTMGTTAGTTTLTATSRSSSIRSISSNSLIHFKFTRNFHLRLHLGILDVPYLFVYSYLLRTVYFLLYYIRYEQEGWLWLEVPWYMYPAVGLFLALIACCKCFPVCSEWAFRRAAGLEGQPSSEFPSLL